MAETAPRRDTLAFQVDLWSARGDFPHNMLDVMTREKEIRYSSRTRAGTDQFKYAQRLRHTLADLLGKLPEDLKNSPEARLLRKEAQQSGVLERFLENLGFQCLLAEQPVKFSNLALQGSIVRCRHDLFAAARRGQTALRHQAAPPEQLVRGNAMPPSN